MTMEIAKYSFRLTSSHDEAHVFLYTEGTEAVAKLIFREGDGELPPPEDVGGRVVLYFRRDHLHDVVDLLRNEEPVYLHWVPPYAFLSTELEPVGEGEEK